jgi:membrane protein
MARLLDGLGFVTTIARIAITEKIRYPAAALAYYAFVSFVPLLLLVFATVGRQLATELARTAPQFLTPPVRQLVDRSLTTATGRTGAGVLAVLVLGWSSANTVGDIRTVIARIEDANGGTVRSLVRDAVVILGSLGLAILAILATSLLSALLPAGLAVNVVRFLCLWLVLSVAVVPLYYVPSSVVTSPTAALPGAVTAALGWTVLHTAVRFYATNADQYAVYGVLGGVIILLTSLYLAAAVLFTGIIINAQITAGPTARG